jgi:hypothetical protein
MIRGRDSESSVLSTADYEAVRRLGDEYLSRNPRSLVLPYETSALEEE